MTAPHDATTTIRDLENDRYRAIVDRDLTRFAELSHPDLAYSHSSGETDTLEDYLDKVRSGFYVYHEIDHPIDFIRIVDDVALVVGEMNADITAGGRDKKLRNRCLAVWKNTDDGWRFLAYQPTPIPTA
ncbi:MULTISPECIES: nuclear transport factor 2 family protein [unclassified Rhodococcus (in: high G+C Gram-positive bacteria)]|uniref:nuclear transport factor 2 family protein n=1 Tax=unclassified Rhodococcus (in: high G+C Gram-positive bacteria) TaxID=192944 RepID=UPI00163AEF7D|nr:MULTISPECIES: nuclear transport factor 2 family protein [unclassified Rhodococcus (in: high G+C Gram-positive bacteria)]MBC2637774.1 nuclear transport factor 2 family protein [Rhodococcus sp. 3A]MBC2897481.1 nuclear transport factor 2 family protein [Rhodococcus sp. 4CII]